MKTSTFVTRVAQLVPTVVLINEKGFVTKKFVTFQNESTLDVAIAERIKRFRGFSQKLENSARIYQEQMGKNASTQLLNQKLT